MCTLVLSSDHVAQLAQAKDMILLLFDVSKLDISDEFRTREFAG